MTGTVREQLAAVQALDVVADLLGHIKAAKLGQPVHVGFPTAEYPCISLTVDSFAGWLESECIEVQGSSIEPTSIPGYEQIHVDAVYKGFVALRLTAARRALAAVPDDTTLGVSA